MPIPALFWFDFCAFLSKSAKIGENGRFALSNFGAVTAEGPYDYGYFVSEWGWELNLSSAQPFEHLTEKNTTKIGAFELSDHHNGHIHGHGRFKFWRSNGR